MKSVIFTFPNVIYDAQSLLKSVSMMLTFPYILLNFIFPIFGFQVLCSYRQAQNATATDKRHQSTTKESESYVRACQKCCSR